MFQKKEAKIFLCVLRVYFILNIFFCILGRVLFITNICSIQMHILFLTFYVYHGDIYMFYVSISYYYVALFKTYRKAQERQVHYISLYSCYLPEKKREKLHECDKISIVAGAVFFAEYAA